MKGRLTAGHSFDSLAECDDAGMLAGVSFVDHLTTPAVAAREALVALAAIIFVD